MLFGCEAKLNLFGIFKEETQKAVNAALFYRPTTAEGEHVCPHHFPFFIKRPNFIVSLTNNVTYSFVFSSILFL